MDEYNVKTPAAFLSSFSCVCVCTQVTWPAYFVEFVHTMEEQRRREGAKAEAEAACGAEAENDGAMSASEEEEEEDGLSSGSDSEGSSSKRAGARRRRRRRGGGGSDSEEEEEEDEEEEEEERDTLETLCSAFQAGEHHLLPLEMKVQALEYLVDRAMEVCSRCRRERAETIWWEVGFTKNPPMFFLGGFCYNVTGNVYVFSR